MVDIETAMCVCDATFLFYMKLSEVEVENADL